MFWEREPQWHRFAKKTAQETVEAFRWYWQAWKRRDTWLLRHIKELHEGVISQQARRIMPAGYKRCPMCHACTHILGRREWLLMHEKLAKEINKKCPMTRKEAIRWANKLRGYGYDIHPFDLVFPDLTTNPLIGEF